MIPLYLITDTETTGLDKDDYLYEVAMHCVLSDGSVIFRHRDWVRLPDNMTKEISDYTLKSPNYARYLQEVNNQYGRCISAYQAGQNLKNRIRGAQASYDPTGRHTYLVGSNPSFDRHFIYKDLELNLDAPFISHKMIDLSNIAMAYFRSDQPIGQAEIMKRFRLGDQTHGAEDDVRAAAECFRRMGSKLW